METSENIQYIESCTIQMENYIKITKKIHVQYKLKKNTQCRYICTIHMDEQILQRLTSLKNHIYQQTH